MTTFAKRSITLQEAKRFLRSYVGGTVYFWSGYGIFAILYSGFGWDWLYAKIICDIVGLSLNYLVQRFWAFSDMAAGRKEQAMAGKFSVVSVVGIGLDYAIISGLKAIGVSPYLGFFISAGVMTIWSYSWYRFWVFYDTTHKKEQK